MISHRIQIVKHDHQNYTNTTTTSAIVVDNEADLDDAIEKITHLQEAIERQEAKILEFMVSNQNI